TKRKSLCSSSNTFFLLLVPSPRIAVTSLIDNSPRSSRFFNAKMMNPRTDKLVRRTTMVATITAAYFLLTADYGPEPNALDPIKKAILSAENRVKGFVFGSSEKP
ncbi:hypothetical protein BT93_H2356, partial [Corymbia citriodora subsp. variegata]